MKDEGASAGTRIFAVVAVALAGIAFAFSPLAERSDAALLDLQWSALARFDSRPAPEDIVIVGVDDATAATISEPPVLWHESLGKALLRVAAARPRAIGLDLPLPERSFDALRPGLDRALLAGLAAARENGPFVVSLSIDSRTRAARPIHGPFLALLQEERLGIGLVARDPDGVTRHFSLAVPTEDGSFPTLAGRLCRALAASCGDGLIHFALGSPYRYVPLQRVLQARDAGTLESLFRDRIVLVGETQRYSGRVEVPVNLAGWELPARDTPGIVVHAQSLRTALLEAAPREAARPLVALLVTLAALAVLVRDWRMTAATALLAGVAAWVLAALALRSGTFVPTSGALLALVLAVAFRGYRAWSARYVIRRR